MAPRGNTHTPYMGLPTVDDVVTTQTNDVWRDKLQREERCYQLPSRAVSTLLLRMPASPAAQVKDRVAPPLGHHPWRGIASAVIWVRAPAAHSLAAPAAAAWPTNEGGRADTVGAKVRFGDARSTGCGDALGYDPGWRPRRTRPAERGRQVAEEQSQRRGIGSAHASQRPQWSEHGVGRAIGSCGVHLRIRR